MNDLQTTLRKLLRERRALKRWMAVGLVVDGLLVAAWLLYDTYRPWIEL